MADKFSVEDIIEEYGSKQTETSDEIQENASEQISDEKTENASVDNPEEPVGDKLKAVRVLGEPEQERAEIDDISFGAESASVNEAEPPQEEVSEPAAEKQLTEKEAKEALKRERREKVESFVLKTDDGAKYIDDDQEPVPEDDISDDESPVSIEYESFEDTPRIKSHINTLKDNLNLRMGVTAVCGAVSLFITMANDLGWKMVQVFDKNLSPSAYTFTNTLMGLIAVFVGYTVVVSGIKNLIDRKPDCDTVASLGIVISIILGVATLFSPDIARQSYYNIYICSGILGLMFNTLGKIIIAKRTADNFSFVSGDFEKYAVCTIKNKEASEKLADSPSPNVVCARKTDFVSGFMKNSYSSDIADTTAKKISPIMLIAAVLIGAVTFLLDKNGSNTTEKVLIALAAFSGTVCICSSLSIMLAVNLPLLRASQKANKNKAVILGYDAAQKLADTDCIVTDASKLFPKGTVDLVNLKITSRTSIEECILMAASISFAAGSILQPTFYRMIKGKTEMLYPVDSFMIEDGQGICGWIQNKRVLLGTRELMTNHSIEGLPTLAKEAEFAGKDQVIYLSISGIVSTLFVVRVQADEQIRLALRRLEYENVHISVSTVDGFLNGSFICNLFDVDKAMVYMIPHRYRKIAEAKTGYKSKLEAGCMTSGKLTSLAELVITARNLRSAAANGMIFQYATAVMGALLTVGMLIFGGIGELSATVVCIYQLIMLLITVGYQHFRNI
ncbi:MAG: hypothetical protein IKR76_08510 [Ruminococcus sp.]|nr:hypothetical protein [Ruminococcus sp.]